eukprot:COSAG04_NODE_4240_length_2212_cov_12.780880_6_plen_113_part_01
MLGEMWRAAGLAKLSALKDYMRDLLGGDEGAADGGGTGHSSPCMFRACSLRSCFWHSAEPERAWLLHCHACLLDRVWLSARLACVSGHWWIGRALSLLTRLTFASVPLCAGKM